MTIRSYLLVLLLPPLTAFLVLIALLFYFNWSEEIIDSFRSRLPSIVIAAANSISPNDVEWIDSHLDDPDLEESAPYRGLKQQLVRLREKLPIKNLYLIDIEHVKEGDWILPNEPLHPMNQVHSGANKNAFREVFLLDASDASAGPVTHPGDYDFSEAEEHRVYSTKKPQVSDIYTSKKTGERFLSAFAPIFDSRGEVRTLLGADVSMQSIDLNLSRALTLIVVSALTTLGLVVLTVYLTANHISKPVQQLNRAALEIAAGDYQAHIPQEGPREVMELANTLNVVSECLNEHISRLKETSLIRDRMYGEHECALVMQQNILRKVIEEFSDPYVKMRLVSAFPSNLRKGLLLKLNQDTNTPVWEGVFSLTLFEAAEPGFSGLLQLNQESGLPLDQTRQAYLRCDWSGADRLLRYMTRGLHPPLVWQSRSQEFATAVEGPFVVESGDFAFIYNTELAEQFETEQSIKQWLKKILVIFSEDGLDSVQTMMTNELNFLAKKLHQERNCQVLCLQIVKS